MSCQNIVATFLDENYGFKEGGLFSSLQSLLVQNIVTIPQIICFICERKLWVQGRQAMSPKTTVQNILAIFVKEDYVLKEYRHLTCLYTLFVACPKHICEKKLMLLFVL